MPFNAWLPWPSFNHGGVATFHWKEKVKGPNLFRRSLNLCLKPLKRDQYSSSFMEPSPIMFKNFFSFKKFLSPSSLSKKIRTETYWNITTMIIIHTRPVLIKLFQTKDHLTLNSPQNNMLINNRVLVWQEIYNKINFLNLGNSWNFKYWNWKF